MSQVEWIEDGHTITFSLRREEVVIGEVACPNEGTVSLCNRQRDYCVVRRFITVYGAEINMGKCDIEGPVEIAWVPLLGESDLDAEFGGVVFVPVADPEYQEVRTGNTLSPE